MRAWTGEQRDRSVNVPEANRLFLHYKEIIELMIKKTGFMGQMDDPSYVWLWCDERRPLRQSKLCQPALWACKKSELCKANAGPSPENLIVHAAVANPISLPASRRARSHSRGA